MISAILPEERAQTKDQEMALRQFHIERALRVKWCIKADEFQFKITVKQNPLTRRGVLSKVSLHPSYYVFIHVFISS